MFWLWLNKEFGLVGKISKKDINMLFNKERGIVNVFWIDIVIW